jgi:hypothetical protein
MCVNRFKILFLSHNITQTYNTKINKYLELSVAMRNLWCLEKISILPLVISATGIVPQSLFKNLKILDLDNTLVVEIQKGILLYSCHIVRKFLNIDTEHNTQQSQNAAGWRWDSCVFTSVKKIYRYYFSITFSSCIMNNCILMIMMNALHTDCSFTNRL